MILLNMGISMHFG